MKAEHGTCWRHKYEGNYLFGGIENPELHDLELMIIITAADYEAQQAAVAAAEKFIENFVVSRKLKALGYDRMEGEEPNLKEAIDTLAQLRALDGKDG